MNKLFVNITRANLLALFLVFSVFTLNGCDEAKDAIDAIDLELNPPSRKPIDRTRLGLNAFLLNQDVFGSKQQQFADIRNTLGVRHVRVLFAWSDQVQPSPQSSLNYSFYDDIANAIPAGVDALVVLAHTPAWMANPANWIDGDPRKTWVERWLRPTVQRYAGSGRIIGFQVWNEPNLIFFDSDSTLDLTNPERYMEMLNASFPIIRGAAPNKLIVMAATTSIQQNFSTTLNYNRALRDMGVENLIDVFAFHYYGRQFERVIQSGGIADFLNSINKPLWITESGAMGVNNQLAYAEEVWPFLREEIPGIDRIYYYRYADIGPGDQNFGLRTNDPAFPVSDLYINLRDGS